MKAVHGDVPALIDAGIVEWSDGGPHAGVVFPYDGVHVDFMRGKEA
ncbi:MAG: hypothetical protein ABI668_10435 [Sphingorhabdus sp.]